MSGEERPGPPPAERPERPERSGRPVGGASRSTGPEPEAEPAPPTSAYLRLVRAGPAGSGPDGPHRLDSGPDDVDTAEREVRALLHQAVGGLQPTPGALQRIQRAVPRRRARRRQAWTGAAAVLLLAAAAVPALRTAVDSQDADQVSASRPARSSGDGGRGDDASLQGGDGATFLPGASAPGTAASTEGAAGRDPNGGGTASAGTSTAGISASPQPGAGATGVEQSGARSPGAAPACRTDQLAPGTVHVDPADSAGTVYGSFSVVNSSAEPCTVEGAGTVQVTSAIGTDASRNPVLAHTAGDPATGLPQPSAGSDTLVLKPGAAYLVRFGWVPDEADATACAATSSTTPSSSASPGATGTTGAATGGSQTAAPGAGDGTPGTARSVSLSHTPAAGAPSVGPATIPGACAGTVYRTGPLPQP